MHPAVSQRRREHDHSLHLIGSEPERGSRVTSLGYPPFARVGGFVPRHRRLATPGGRTRPLSGDPNTSARGALPPARTWSKGGPRGRLAPRGTQPAPTRGSEQRSIGGKARRIVAPSLHVRQGVVDASHICCLGCSLRSPKSSPRRARTRSGVRRAARRVRPVELVDNETTPSCRLPGSSASIAPRQRSTRLWGFRCCFATWRRHRWGIR
jgi:hypothetical protein